uniref:Uncharacterized protein n=1 Tax=Anopheles atroparvus TaxID=41427 RepID=A0A182IK79_ANOAO
MDPLEQVRVFLDCFKANVNPTDPLPVRVPVYNLKYDEIKPAIVDWTRTYLDQFGCPPCILTPIIRKVSEAVLSHCKENPQSCGYTGRDYKTLQLNHEVISRVNHTCSELLDNENLNKLLAELSGECQAVDQTDSMVATRRKTHFSRGVKHKRRTMEDRHVCLPDFNSLFDTKDTEPTAFYGVYDGHGGQEAASFAASHLHYNVAQSVHYPHQMELAFWEGFLMTDKQFLEKCDNHHLRSGSTVVVCFHRLISKKIHIAWVGDSQAILVAGSPSGCTYDTLVHPTHAASNPVGIKRFKNLNASVVQEEPSSYGMGSTVLMGRNPYHKDVVTAQPDTTWRRYNEEDAFLVLASDGLWENCLSYSISMFILYAIRKFPGKSLLDSRVYDVK